MTILTAPAPTERTAPEPRPAGPVMVSVCTSCRAAEAAEEPRPGARMLEAMQAALGPAPGVLVRPVECLGVCKRPVTVAVSAANGFTFVFGDLDAASAPDAVATFARDYARADHGFVPWRQRAEVLRRGLVARIPPPGWSPADGKPPG